MAVSDLAPCMAGAESLGPKQGAVTGTAGGAKCLLRLLPGKPCSHDGLLHLHTSAPSVAFAGLVHPLNRRRVFP